MKRDDKIITYDVEICKEDNGNFVLYACGWYDSKDTHLYYLTYFNNFE